MNVITLIFCSIINISHRTVIFNAGIAIIIAFRMHDFIIEIIENRNNLILHSNKNRGSTPHKRSQPQNVQFFSLICNFYTSNN